jgi:hypothetical protein
MESFSQEVSPKPATSIAEILAAKKAKKEGIVVEVMPREEGEIPPEQEGEDFDSNVLVDSENEEEIEDSFDLINRPSNARSFKGEI